MCCQRLARPTSPTASTPTSSSSSPRPTRKAGAKGISLILVEADRDGFARGRNLDKIGFHSADTSELFFDDVRLPTTNCLGREGRASPI